jgi:hypothetical protein
LAHAPYQVYVIVFDEELVIQAEAVVEAAAQVHSPFFQGTPEGRGFTGVQDLTPRTGYSFYISPGECGDPAQPLQQVEH